VPIRLRVWVKDFLVHMIESCGHILRSCIKRLGRGDICGINDVPLFLMGFIWLNVLFKEVLVGGLCGTRGGDVHKI